ncbi:MAG: hypothetical protein DRN27_06690 [Thermoplasmata archaeon]|nr:MAG: hypothetical protein DRN27_06690 [Thermoplasmata archaeon]
MLRFITTIIIISLLFSMIPASNSLQENIIISYGPFFNQSCIIDYDPLIDLNITIKINSIRIFENKEANIRLEIQINDRIFISPQWNTTDHNIEVNWSIQEDIPDDEKIVEIYIRLYDSNELCDINGEVDKKQAHILFDVRTGHWFGDDYLGDLSGYGRLNGYDDKKFETSEKDSEIFFEIYLNDYDKDGIPYEIEVETYRTDPRTDDSGKDFDNDSIPIEWEWKWGYNPLLYDDFSNIDYDADGLNDLEEFWMFEWDSDPFRKDIFLEIDQMEPGPDGEGSWILTNGCKELLKNPFHKRNIVLHIDGGSMGEGEMIPFDSIIDNVELLELYNEYFLENNSNNWRRGVFRYGLIIYHHEKAAGKAFVGEGFPINSNVRGINSFQISKTAANQTMKVKNHSSDFIYATYIMHEMGHTMGIDIFNPPGCDNKNTVHPLFFGWWKYANYKSVMNYRYVHDILDYSDGTHGKYDYDDWGNLDLSWFEIPLNDLLYSIIQDVYQKFIKIH